MRVYSPHRLRLLSFLIRRKSVFSPRRRDLCLFVYYARVRDRETEREGITKLNEEKERREENLVILKNKKKYLLSMIGKSPYMVTISIKFSKKENSANRSARFIHSPLNELLSTVSISRESSNIVVSRYVCNSSNMIR